MEDAKPTALRRDRIRNVSRRATDYWNSPAPRSSGMKNRRAKVPGVPKCRTADKSKGRERKPLPQDAIAHGLTLFEKGGDGCGAKESGFSNPLNEWTEEEQADDRALRHPIGQASARHSRFADWKVRAPLRFAPPVGLFEQGLA